MTDKGNIDNIIHGEVHMLNSTVLDITISLIFVYITLSLICMTITEAVTRVFSSREKIFEKTIGNVLKNFTGADDAINLFMERLQLYYGAEYKDTGWRNKKNLKIKSFGNIPTKTIAAVMLDVINHYNKGSKTETTTLARLVGNLSIPAKKGKSNLEEMKNNMVSKVEDWTAPLMDKIAETYKKNAERYAMIVAIIVVSFNNADTISMTAKIKQDTFNRAVLTKPAEELASKLLSTKNINNTEEIIIQNLGLIQVSGLPFGPESWRDEINKFKSDNKESDTKTKESPVQTIQKKEKPNFILWLVSKISGLIATIALVSLGAPFWLNALKKIVEYKKNLKRGS